MASRTTPFSRRAGPRAIENEREIPSPVISATNAMPVCHKEIVSKWTPWRNCAVTESTWRSCSRADSHWQQVHTRVDQVGRQTTDPYEIRRLRQELEMITGTEFAEIIDQMAYHFETLGTFFR